MLILKSDPLPLKTMGGFLFTTFIVPVFIIKKSLILMNIGTIKDINKMVEMFSGIISIP